jgi:cysteinyl-tRNA synthetase
MTSYITLLSALALILLAACAESDDDEANAPAPTATASAPSPTPAGQGNADRMERLRAVNDFLYQLQELDLEAVGGSAYDLIVMDYSADGTEGEMYTREQIEGLKRSPGGQKIVLAYMSIGEAEEYRYYWRPGWKTGSPEWLDEPNPSWIRNYKVEYWDPEWQAIVFDYTDRLIDAGFDGAYLDIIDAYEYFEDRGRDTAAQEMADFVAAIAARARERSPGFYIFPQNGAALARIVPGYLDFVDGIGQEDIYYGYDGDDKRTPANATAETERELDLFRQAGKLVLTVDYATTPFNVDDAYRKSRAKGYVPFVTTRDLDRLIINKGHEPD